MIKTILDYTNLNLADLIKNYQKQISTIHNNLEANAKNEDGWLGWINMPFQYDADLVFKESWKRMKALATKLQEEVQVLVVIGIGGSYLGTRAGLDMIQGLFPKIDKVKGVKVIYLGNTMSSTYVQQVIEYLKDKDFAINVISKSGTTTEPAIAFRLLKELLIKQKKNKTEIASRIITTTDKSRGVLHDLSQEEGYQTFIIPDNIGGRYSVLTPVGMFPMMVAGIDCQAIINGAKLANQECKNDKIDINDAYLYAAVRYHLYKTNKAVEILVSYETQMQMFCEWWKQLFGESEGKEGKGLFPASVIFSTDLHSMGQFMQEGSKIFFETVIKIKKPNQDLKIAMDKANQDQLNYLTKYSLHEINNIALQGTIEAHSDQNLGKTPNILLEWEKMDAEMFGYASFFFMKACAVSAMLLGVDPFDQPGVEVYKKKMFSLLGK
ncbi:glucose-6-phosphate isomerase [Spiroplasma sp. AdecLV25b]|uniref:glucose-6-phosphate isomerase n=1 Tax=Spiroplasma sp. AdecLV25b TaxID=3027162 RepID=UPI0027DF53FD|nr:glucose-6-phosphate isomerase [Spiroplasma sp. AdecLV25b]